MVEKWKCADCVTEYDVVEKFTRQGEVLRCQTPGCGRTFQSATPASSKKVVMRRLREDVEKERFYEVGMRVGAI